MQNGKPEILKCNNGSQQLARPSRALDLQVHMRLYNRHLYVRRFRLVLSPHFFSKVANVVVVKVVVVVVVVAAAIVFDVFLTPNSVLGERHEQAIERRHRCSGGRRRR